MLNKFPLLAIPAIIYNVIAFADGMLSGASQDVVAGLNHPLFSVPMASGAAWNIASGDLVLLMALLMLFVEFIKAARNGRDAALNQTLSLALFIICLLEFLLVPAFASTLFFLITMMTLLDVVAGYLIPDMAPLSEDEREDDYDDYEDP